MNYKLQFRKISNEHKFAGVGMAGNIFIILNALTYLNDNDVLFIDMETNECCCTQNDLDIFKTKNPWEYYFDQNNIDDNYIMLDNFCKNNLNYEDRDFFINIDNFYELKQKFYNNFRLKKYLKQIIDNFFTLKIQNKKTLGVQIRLTDMQRFCNTANLEIYISKIHEILSENREIEQIFVASDDIEAIQKLKECFSIPIIYHENIFRATKTDLHLDPYDRFENQRIHHRYKLSLECLMEVFTLTKCDYFLKADLSSLSLVACILSENIKKVYKV